MINQTPPNPRIAIITGAAQGIGEAIVLRLADDGIDVVLNDLPIKNDALDGVVKAVQAKGRRAIAVLGDATIEADVIALVDKAVEEFGGLDIVRPLLRRTSCVAKKADDDTLYTPHRWLPMRALGSSYPSST